jgi:hypothetical protein
LLQFLLPITMVTLTIWMRRHPPRWPRRMTDDGYGVPSNEWEAAYQVSMSRRRRTVIAPDHREFLIQVRKRHLTHSWEVRTFEFRGGEGGKTRFTRVGAESFAQEHDAGAHAARLREIIVERGLPRSHDA